jgi:hypothetical protein
MRDWELGISKEKGRTKKEKHRSDECRTERIVAASSAASESER